MQAATRHVTPNSTSFPKIGEVSCLVRDLEDHPFRFLCHKTKLSFIDLKDNV